MKIKLPRFEFRTRNPKEAERRKELMKRDGGCYFCNRNYSQPLPLFQNRRLRHRHSVVGDYLICPWHDKWMMDWDETGTMMEELHGYLMAKRKEEKPNGI